MNHRVETVKDVDRIKVSLEETREKILALLRVNDMSISQIAEVLNKDQSTISRHIKKLERAGFVEIVGEKKEHHIPERIYGRTADTFLIHPEPHDIKNLAALLIDWNLGCNKDTLEKLELLGYCEDFDERTLTNLIDFLDTINEHLSLRADGTDESVFDMNIQELIKLKLLLYLIEIKKNPDLSDFFEQVFSDFDSIIKYSE